jgi:hypothetical protein
MLDGVRLFHHPDCVTDSKRNKGNKTIQATQINEDVIIKGEKALLAFFE